MFLHAIQIFALVGLLQRAPIQPPPDVKPTSPTLEDVTYIKAPTLELGGEKDGATPNWSALAKKACETIPQCELAILPNLGHVPHFEAPELFHKTLLKFLKQ